MSATKKTVLIVEDNQGIREALKDILELEGYQIYTSSNGQEAIDLIHNGNQPGLILLDLMTPVMNGWEFLDAYKSASKACPVVVLSAVKEKPSLGVAAYLRKPVEIETLLQTVRKYCA